MFSNAQVSLINLTDQLSKAHNDRMAFLDARIAAITALIGGAAR